MPLSREVNAFICACDLGTKGLFYHFSERITLTLTPDATERQKMQHPAALCSAYEAWGCQHVSVEEIGDYTAPPVLLR